jgi:hypothetical protein
VHISPPSRQLRGGHRLVGALAAGDGHKIAAEDRLTGFGHAAQATDQVHVDRTNDDNRAAFTHLADAKRKAQSETAVNPGEDECDRKW